MYQGMIQSTVGDLIESVIAGKAGNGFPTDVLRVAIRKLAMIDAAHELGDLRSPPGNRLEALKGDRAGQHSIRANDQWRFCFVWGPSGPERVELCDYH